MDSTAVTDGQLSIRFEHTRAEFTAALRAVMRRGRTFVMIAGIAGALFSLGLLAVLGGGDGSVAMIGVFLLAWLAFVYVYCPLAQWRNESIFRGPRELTFDDHGVGCITPVSETRLRWSFFTGMVETDRCWVLLRRAQCIPVPKAAFASAADVERFRTLVAEQVKPSA